MSKRQIQVRTSNFSYRVVIEEGSLSVLGKAMRLLFPSEQALLVSDNRVFSLYGDRTIYSLEEEGWKVKTALISPGERSKTLRGASRLYDRALDSGLDRNSPIIALGGGVVGDLAGFVASTYLRGVPLVMVPTSLLAQVDSSVGGKVAVNHPRGKNLIGSIYPPRLVLIDPRLLDSLPGRQIKAGLAEVVKYGIIYDSAFFNYCEEELENLLRRKSSSLAEAVARSVQIKANVVEEDEFEKDYRRILNFGHTIGHALEAATAYKYYLHGEAVLIGMAAATGIAASMEKIDTHLAERIINLLQKIGLKKPPMGLTTEMVIDKLRQDKKRRDGKIVLILPVGIGSVAVSEIDSEDLIRGEIDKYLRVV
ncbi:MAG: 3-dehydroquinate synthase [Bacillota bacterium]|nr:3-dehydroquinate synthase [Bacillota bacterium]